MSGGSWDYVFQTFDDIGERLIREKGVLRQALGARVLLLAKAMRSIEWVDSGDYAPGAELDDIHAALGGSGSTLLVETQLLKLRDALNELFDKKETA